MYEDLVMSNSVMNKPSVYSGVSRLFLNGPDSKYFRLSTPRYYKL